MKNILFILPLFLSLQTFAGISIVSDLDDTIKITNSGEEIEGGINAFLKDDVFTGMPEFLTQAKAYTNELHILSASPHLLRSKILKSFKKRNIEIASLTLKNSLGGETKLEYKVKELKRIFESNSDDFILLGDDVGQDPEAYAEIQKLYPTRVLAIYIHVIKNRPFSGTPYWTSFDLFLREYLASRMTDSVVQYSAELILSEKKFPFIIPTFANCPSESRVWSWQLETPFLAEAQKVSEHIIKQCKVRSSGILALE